MAKRMVSAARTMVNDLRRRWMRWMTVLPSCCELLIGNNDTDDDFLLVLLLRLDKCMFSRVLLEVIDLVDAHLLVTDAERALIRGDSHVLVVENASTIVALLQIAARAVAAIRVVFTMVDAAALDWKAAAYGIYGMVIWCWW